MTKPNNHDIIRALQEGNKKLAGELLVCKYNRFLHAKAHFVLGDDAKAADAVQDLYMRMLQLKRCNIKDLDAYVSRAIHNICLDVIRKEKKREKRRTRLFAKMYSNTIQEPLEYPETSDEVRKLNVALSNLSDRCREAIMLVYYESLSYKAAAVRMGITENSIKTHLRIAMRYLRKDFGVI